MNNLVLVGGGHSHVQLLRRWIMRPLPDTRVMVVVDRPVAVYSGMVPGLVAGQYTRRDVEIDVRPLARRAGARVITAAATSIDPEARTIQLRDRPAIPYDLASVNIGSTVALQDLPGVREHAIATRPIGRFVERFERLVAATTGACNLVVVGGGAGGVELAFCARERLLAQGLDVHVTLVDGSRILARNSEAVRARVLTAASERGIEIREGARVVQVHPDSVELEDCHLPADAVLWVTGATSTSFFADSGLPTDARGFVIVDAQLRVQGRHNLFAAGDCAVLADWPDIPKAGVYAVRQGPILEANLRARLADCPLRAYRAQRDFFSLLNLGDGTAIGTKWGRTIQGHWAFRWKDRIDRAFMQRFQVLNEQGEAEAFTRGLPPMPPMDAPCGGCAAKVGPDALSAALRRLDVPVHPAVAVGIAEAEDVTAIRRPDGLVVQSVDAFPAFVDDPWLVGRIAAVNALSDLQAKGIAPTAAMALVTLPEDADAEETLFQVLAGARVTLDGEGVALSGGHSTVGPQLVVGFSVTGFGEGIVGKGGLDPGDLLVLARPLGTGVLFHADMAGRAEGPWIDGAITRMSRGNGSAGRVVRELGLRASTDVTGFGLAGHLLEMVRAADLAAELVLDDLPALDGALELLARGERSTFHEQNRRLSRAFSGETGPRFELLFDPQTAGGLLLGVPPDRLEAVLSELRAAGDEPAVIGAARQGAGTIRCL